MRTGGANVTPQHIEDISLCGLFLMEVAKHIDHQFGVHHTSRHTTLDASEDITKLAHHLVEKGVVSMDSPDFEDPTVGGLNKLCNTTWIKDTLNKVELDDNLEREDIHGITDSTYELCDVI